MVFPLFSMQASQPHHYFHPSMVPLAPFLWQLPGMGVPPLSRADKNSCKVNSTSAQLAWPFSHPLCSD